MKALVFASLVVSAVAAPAVGAACAIPTEYALSNGLGSCLGNAPGYKTTLLCWFFPSVGSSLVRQTLDSTTAAGFATAMIAGCAIPAEETGFTAGKGFAMSTGSTITTTCPVATGAAAPAGMPITKGLEVDCATNFFPTQGAKTVMGCGGLAGFAFIQAAPATTGAFVPLPENPTASLTTTATRLQCRMGCTISDTTICQNSQLQVVGTNFYNAADTKNDVLADCIVKPGKSINLISKYGRKIVYRCDAAATTASPGTLVLTEGAQWLNQIRLGYEAWYYGAVGQSAIPAGTYNFDDIAGVVLRLSNTVPNFRAAVVPIPGLTPQTAVIDGCASVECAQRALLWARCRGFVFYNDMCYAASVQIPCPTAERGFSCPDSSKKGLLGLLGLLGLIPLLLCCCLLLCCLFGPCALRRKKSGADVQFATFDPHAAPVAQSFVAQPCAPMDYCAPTACATGYVA